MALPITITDAGRAEIINAQNTGTGPVTITEVGFGTGQYTPLKTRTALQAQVKRVGSIAGQAVAADTIHVMALDESASSYNVGEFGLFSDKGTLIAVYSQPAASGWIIQKAGPSTLLLATDIILESLDATSITFGDISFINPPATTTTQGVVQLNNTLTSTSTSQALTAAQGKKLQDEKQPLDATLTALAGLVLASNKLIYSTGSDTFATTDLSAFARTLLDDADAATALKTLGAAPLDSPELIGTPTAPTPAATDRDTSLANTAFVRAAMALYGLGGNAPTYRGNIDDPADVPQGIVFCAAASATGTFPTASGLIWSGGIAGDGFVQEWYEVNTGATTKRRFYRTIYAGDIGPWREIWHTGNLIKQTDPADTTAGAVMAVGAGGLLGSALVISGADLNSERPTGFYYCSSPVNGPGAGNGWLLHEDLSTAGYAAQTYKTASAVRVFTRTQINGVWTAWVESYHTGNVSTFIQTLLDDADASAARTTLGLVKQTSATDTTAGSVLLTGAGGWLGNVPTTSLANIDDKTLRGMRYVSAGTTGSKPANIGVVHTFGLTNDTVGQEFWEVTGATSTLRRWYRQCYGNASWGAWFELIHTGNVSSFTDEAAPAGEIAHFARSTAPAGWLKANGAAVSRASYSKLYAAIGTTFGAGDGISTFNVPDLRGEFIRGWDDGRGVDSGRLLGSLQSDDFKSHRHAMFGGFGDEASTAYVDTTAGLNQNTGYTELTGGTETRPRNVALLACIKY